MIDFDAEVTRIYELANRDPRLPPTAVTMANDLLGPECIRERRNLPWRAEYNSVLRKIYLRPSLEGVARSFAIFHELGEAICHELGYTEPDKEQVAHGLGVRLMIPKEAWRPAIREFGGDLWKLALRFRTSETIVALRRAEITGLPTAVVAPGFIMIRGEPYSFGRTEGQIRQLARGTAKTDGIRSQPLTDAPRTILIAS